MATIFDCSDSGALLTGMRLARGAIGRGELVVMPTDTVYGVAADAFDPVAVQRLLDAKGRTRQSPPPVLIPGIPTLDALTEEVPPEIRRLVEIFWPGALTVILPARSSLQWDLGDTGGTVLLAVIAAVAFATILAVVAGLTLSGASAVSHDIYATVIKKGQADSKAELKISRLTTLGLGVVAIMLGIVFEKQNIAFMVSLAFAIAASANFPVLLMSVLWKGCTTRGAVIGGFLGLISSVALTVVSPAVWEATLGNPAGSALFPYASPTLFSMTLAFVGIWLFSVLDSSKRGAQDRAGFVAQQVRSETGIGASGASGH